VFNVSTNTVYRLYGRQFYKRPNQQYQSTEGKDATKVNPEKANNTKYSNTINKSIYKKNKKIP